MIRIRYLGFAGLALGVAAALGRPRAVVAEVMMRAASDRCR